MSQPLEIPLGWPLPKQRLFLIDLTKSGTASYGHQIRFQGQTRTLPVYTVEIDLPKYRLANGRTQAAQEEYLAKHPKLVSDFFSRDQESDEAQAVQHQILWDMVKDSLLHNYFKDLERSQEQPLILSDKGFVVNGNRRLCAMRQLYYGDHEKYTRYSHIDVVILPHCSDKDIDELEAYLQIQPDIKEEYTWIAKACMLRARQKHYNYTYQQLADLYGLSVKDIQAIFAQLDLVDDYLAGRGRQKQYDLVEHADYAFKQLQKARPQIKQLDRRDVFTQVSYCLIDDSSTAGRRLYDLIPKVRDNLEELIDRLVQELPLEAISAEPQPDLGLFGDLEDNNTNLEPLIQAIARSENRSLLVESVTDVISGQEERERQRNKANAVLTQIIEANTHLKNAILYFDEDASQQGIEEQLLAIEESIWKIREWLANDA